MATQQDVVTNLLHSCMMVNGRMREVGYQAVVDEKGNLVDLVPYFRAEDQVEASMLPEMNWTLQ